MKEDGKDHQNVLVSSVQTSIQESGNLQTENLEISVNIKKRQKQQMSLNRRTLGKTVSQFGRYQQYFAFIRWRKQVKDYNEYRTQVKHAIMQRIHCRQLYGAFQTWRRNQVLMFKEVKELEFEEVRHQQATEIGSTEAIKVRMQEQQNLNLNKLEQIQASQEYEAAKCKNLIGKLIADKNLFFSIKVVENVFVTWKNYT